MLSKRLFSKPLFLAVLCPCMGPHGGALDMLILTFKSLGGVGNMVKITCITLNIPFWEK